MYSIPTVSWIWCVDVPLSALMIIRMVLFCWIWSRLRLVFAIRLVKWAWRGRKKVKGSNHFRYTLGVILSHIQFWMIWISGRKVRKIWKTKSEFSITWTVIYHSIGSLEAHIFLFGPMDQFGPSFNVVCRCFNPYFHLKFYWKLC